MSRIGDKEIMQEVFKLSCKYPEIDEIIIEYNGSGDSFDSYDIDYRPNNKKIRIEDEDIEPIFWEAVERMGCGFDNDGSRGTVTINLKDGTVTGDNYDYVIEEVFNNKIII